MAKNSIIFESEIKKKRLVKRKYIPPEKWIIVAVILVIYLVMALLTFPRRQETAKSDPKGGVIEDRASVQIFLDKRAFSVYLVQSNDTLGQIADYFRVPLSSIKNENKVLAANPRELKIGDKVIINLKKVR